MAKRITCDICGREGEEGKSQWMQELELFHSYGDICGGCEMVFLDHIRSLTIKRARKEPAVSEV